MGRLIGKIKYFLLVIASIAVAIVVRHYIVKKPKKVEKVIKKPVKKVIEVQKVEKKPVPEVVTKPEVKKQKPQEKKIAKKKKVKRAKRKKLVKKVKAVKKRIRRLVKKVLPKKKPVKITPKPKPSVSAPSPALAPAPAPPSPSLQTVKKQPAKKQVAKPQQVTKPKKQVKKQVVKKPKPKKVTKIFIKRIVIQGNTVIPTQVLHDAVKNYEGRVLTLKDFRKIAEVLTKIYFDKGYVTSWAYLPPQNLSNHILHVKIFEGKVGKVAFLGESKYYSRSYLLSYVENLKPGSVFNQDLLERDLLNLNDNMNLKVTASLKKGDDPGATDIYFHIENSTFPFTAQVSYDNFGSKYTSKDRYGLSFSLGNFPFYGSVLNFAGIMGSSYDRLHSYSITYQTPIGRSGLKGGIWFSQGNSNLGRELAVLNIKNYSTFLGFFVSYPLTYLINKKVVLEASLNFLDTKQSMLSKISGEFKYHYAQVSLKWYKSSSTSENILSFSLTQGLGNLLEKSTGITIAGRSNPSSTFSKVNIDYNRVQKINDNLFIILKLKGQYSQNTLYASQDFYIGGPSSVRGFLVTQYGGDIGYLASGELRWAPLKDKTRFQFLTFVDTGSIYLNNPAPGESKHHSLTGVGFGLRLNLPNNTHWLVDVGYPIHPHKDGGVRSVNFYVKIYKKF